MIRNLMFPKYDENGRIKLAIPPKKRIIYLDFDGVIIPPNSNSELLHDIKRLKHYLADKYHDSIYLEIPNRDLGVAFYDWDIISLGRVKKISDTCNAEIIVSSDYIVRSKLEWMKAMFKLYGMDEYIYDICDWHYPVKVESIKGSLEKYKDIIENYVVIDDSDKLSVFGNHFIQTKDKISEEDVKKAIKILGVY